MKEITVENWEAFESELIKLRQQHQKRSLIQNLLFRGQAKSNWELSTTLERGGQRAMSFVGYYKAILIARSEIEAFTENKWDLPDLDAVAKSASRYEFLSTNKELLTSIYGYMAHLRHHGFRSPLLDWTKSAYIAAYFAFSHAIEAESVSIYALLQANSHSSSSSTPTIHTFGPIVRTHKRHFLQQCEYSLCATMKTGDLRFVEHESAETDWEDEENDFLVNFQIYKFNIPGHERLKVLKILDGYNLNAFSLFGSEEGLMEIMARRAFDFSD